MMLGNYMHDEEEDEERNTLEDELYLLTHTPHLFPVNTPNRVNYKQE